MALTWQDVINTAPNEAAQLELFTIGQQNKIITRVEAMAKAELFYEDLQLAQELLAAHFATSALGEAAGRGSLSSENIGGVSVSYTMPVNNPTPNKPWLSTWYGREYNQLVNKWAMTVFTI